VETFLARYRNVTVLALALFAQLLLLGYQVQGRQDVPLIRIWAVTAITPVARLLHGTQQLASSLWSRYIWLREAGLERERLRAELDRLKLENQALRNDLATAGRLEVLAGYQQKIPSRTLAASVIGAGANPNARVVFLDKGSGSGLRPGLGVITPDGIVGKIQAAYPGASLALLISDTQSAVGVVLEKSRAHGVLKGAGLHEARIEYVGLEEKVAAGEKVYTSGEDRIFPKGLLVGTISKAQPGREFQDLRVQPGARLNRLEEVLVILEGVHQDLPEDLPRPQPPVTLLPAPPPEAGGDLLGPAKPATSGSAYVPQTDADRLATRYRELGQSQGHTFGHGLPGSKPPDFNQGWSPPGRPAPVKAPPAAPLPQPPGI